MLSAVCEGTATRSANSAPISYSPTASHWTMMRKPLRKQTTLRRRRWPFIAHAPQGVLAWVAVVISDEWIERHWDLLIIGPSAINHAKIRAGRELSGESRLNRRMS